MAMTRWLTHKKLDVLMVTKVLCHDTSIYKGHVFQSSLRLFIQRTPIANTIQQ